MWPTQPTIQLQLKSPGQADCSPKFLVEIKNESIVIWSALYAFILAHGLYLFLYRESVLCVRQGVIYPAMSVWVVPFPVPVFPTVLRGVVCDDE